MEKFLINLKRRDDRLKLINLPFNYKIFEATDGKVKYVDYPKNEQGFMGCLDSHRRLFSFAKENDINTIMILEDDVIVCDDFIIKLKKVMSELPDNWDLLYLGGWNVGEKIKYSDSLDVAKKVYTTHAFIVKNKFFDTIINQINSRDWKVDVLLSEVLEKGNCFICNPTIAWQREGYSDIENKITNNKHLI